MDLRTVRAQRWVSAGVGMVAAIAALGLISPSAQAVDPESRQAQIRKQIQAEQQTIRELTAESAVVLQQLNQTKAKHQAATAQLKAARATEVRATARKKQLDIKLARARAAEAIGQSLLNDNEQTLSAAEDVRNNMARSAYQGGGSEKIAILLDPLNAAELTDRLYMMEKVTDVQQAVVGDLKLARAAALKLQAQLLDARRQTATLSLQAKAALQEAAAARAQAAQATAQIAQLVQQQQAQSQALAQRKAQEVAKVAELQAESNKIAALLEAKRRAREQQRRRNNRPSGPPAGSGTLQYPVNASIGSEFGMRFHPVLRTNRLHAGLDFNAGCGAPVYAAGAGDIVAAGWAGGYGNRIVIDHGNVATVYAHLTSIARGSGSVSRGQLIGYVGTTGMSTGCHLHFETRVNGAPRNPRNFF